MKNKFEIHLKPIDKLAAIVVSRGFHFEAKIKKDCHDERDILPACRLHWASKEIFDLTGLKVGWLTVIGLSEEKKDRWVCRCVCGKYLFRTAKSLKKDKTVIDKCLHCLKLDYIRK
jgi:hypothetical protein